MKNRNYIQKSVANLVLFGYLFILTANVLHYHKVDINFNPRLKTNSNQNSEFEHNILTCSIQLASQSIHNFILIPDNFDNNIKSYFELLSTENTLSKVKKEISLQLKLRAPPSSYLI